MNKHDKGEHNMDHTNAAKMPDNTKLEEVLEAYAKEQNKDNLVCGFKRSALCASVCPGSFSGRNGSYLLKRSKTGREVADPQGIITASEHF